MLEGALAFWGFGILWLPSDNFAALACMQPRPLCLPRSKHLRRFQFQKNPRVRKICVRNSGAGNGCANFMDAWKKCVRSGGKDMSIKFLVLGGGGYFGFGGGGRCRFYFYEREDFLTILKLA